MSILEHVLDALAYWVEKLRLAEGMVPTLHNRQEVT